MDFFYYIEIVEYFTEQQRENDRALRRAGRDIERERRKLEDEERKIVNIEFVYLCWFVVFSYFPYNGMFDIFTRKRR